MYFVYMLYSNLQGVFTTERQGVKYVLVMDSNKNGEFVFIFVMLTNKWEYVWMGV